MEASWERSVDKRKQHLVTLLDHGDSPNAKHGGLAQLGERHTGSVKVIGSSPLSSTSLSSVRTNYSRTFGMHSAS